MRRRPAGLLCALLLLLGGGAARAGAQAGPSLPALADAVGGQVAPGLSGAPVALFVQGSPQALTEAFTTLLSAALTARGLTVLPLAAAGPQEAEARARGLGAHALVRLWVDVQGQQVRARGDVLGTWVNFWSGRAPTRPERPAGALALTVPADAEALTLASGAEAGGPGGPWRLEAVRLAVLPLPPAALAAGDLDGDGRAELAVLVGEEVWVLGGDGQERARASLATLPPSPTPCRQPYGVLSIGGRPAELAAFSCAHAQGSRLTLTPTGLQPGGTLATPRAGRGPQLLEAPLLPGQAALGPALRPVAGGAPLTPSAPVVELALARGEAPAALLLHPGGSATLLPQLTAREGGLPLEGVGHGSALADMDGDGTLELLASSPAVAPEPERLRAHRLPTPLRALGAGLPAPEAEWVVGAGRVLQLVALDVEGDGREEVVAGVWRPDGTGELVLVRARPGGAS